MCNLLIINAHRQYESSPVRVGDWLGVYSLAAFLHENGHPARAFAGFAHEVPALLEEYMAQGVNVVGFSCDYENQVEVAAFCRLVKSRWDVPVIVGGPQAMALGEDFLRTSGADVVVRGEGELPTLELMYYFINGTGNLAHLRGISFMQNQCFVRTPDQAPITNLDALPFPNAELVLGTWFRKDTASFLTARGCPFRCSFCYEGGNTRGVRWRSVQNVMREVEEVLRTQPRIRYILFTDDTFTLNPRRVREFVKELVKLRHTYDFGWFAEAHVATLVRHPELVAEMIKAGLVTLQIGIESGAAHVLRAYNKKVSPAMIEDAVELCHHVGLPHMVGNIIVGGAMEDEETCATSREFGLRLLQKGKGMLEMHAINFWPLPGTAMTLRPQDFGMEILDPQSRTSATDYPVVRCGALGPERLSCLRFEMDTAFQNQVASLASGLTPQRVETHFALAAKYNFFTGWYYELYSLERCRRFAVVRSAGAARLLCQVPPEQRHAWHPQRTCTPRTHDGIYFGGDIPVDASLFPVLVASAGRMTSQEAADHCHMSLEDFLANAEQLEAQMALLFCEY